jgi:large subunit ribosomal protein L1
MKAVTSTVTQGKFYPVDEALQMLQAATKVKFVESVDAAIRLGIDAKKSDQGVRGSTVLPHGTGKSVRVAVFTAGPNVEKALEAGAEAVGMEDLAAKMKDGDLNYDVIIASPDAMRVVGQLGQLLGPRGLMPNPKVGTVTADVAGAVRNAKAGQIRYRNDKAGIIHCTIGKVSFDAEHLKANLQALIGDLQKMRPAAAKGQYLLKVSLSTTMGPGIHIEQSSLATSKV